MGAVGIGSWAQIVLRSSPRTYLSQIVRHISLSYAICRPSLVVGCFVERVLLMIRSPILMHAICEPGQPAACRALLALGADSANALAFDQTVEDFLTELRGVRDRPIARRNLRH